MTSMEEVSCMLACKHKRNLRTTISRIVIGFLVLWGLQGQLLQADDVAATAGTTFLEAPSARASGLGEALTALGNDAAAYWYNPASLSTLESSQATFLYQRGSFDDSYGSMLVGAPMGWGGAGLSASFYDGGEMPLIDGTVNRTVSAQRDWTVNLGLAGRWDRFSYGVSAKYLSSQLGEIARGDTFAGDVGAQFHLNRAWSFGAAAQNIGTGITYVEKEMDLPELVRMGLVFNIFPHTRRLSVLLDSLYMINEEDWRRAGGLEVDLNPVVLRVGYKSGNDLEGLTLGSGFCFKKMSIDYSFGFVEEFEARHRISFSLRFGEPKRLSS